MPVRTSVRTNGCRFLLALAAGVAVPLCTLPVPTLAQQVTMETLLDRVQIEDLLVRYYYELSMGRAHEMSEYFTDAVRPAHYTRWRRFAPAACCRCWPCRST